MCPRYEVFELKTLALGLALTAGLSGSAGRGDYPIYCGGHAGRYVALTFDDGPGTTTPNRCVYRTHPYDPPQGLT